MSFVFECLSRLLSPWLCWQPNLSLVRVNDAVGKYSWQSLIQISAFFTWCMFYILEIIFKLLTTSCSKAFIVDFCVSGTIWASHLSTKKLVAFLKQDLKWKVNYVRRTWILHQRWENFEAVKVLNLRILWRLLWFLFNDVYS